MIRCAECSKPVIEMTKYQNWLRIYNFFEFLFMEGYIEQSTYESMVDNIMTFKLFAITEEDQGDTPT
jgi:hypothetical protein